MRKLFQGYRLHWRHFRLCYPCYRYCEFKNDLIYLKIYNNLYYYGMMSASEAGREFIKRFNITSNYRVELLLFFNRADFIPDYTLSYEWDMFQQILPVIPRVFKLVVNHGKYWSCSGFMYYRESTNTYHILKDCIGIQFMQPIIDILININWELADTATSDLF